MKTRYALALWGAEIPGKRPGTKVCRIEPSAYTYRWLAYFWLGDHWANNPRYIHKNTVFATWGHFPTPTEIRRARKRVYKIPAL